MVSFLLVSDRQEHDFLGQISFEVESCNLKEKEWWFQSHSAHIYKDNMYIIGKKSQNIEDPYIVNKFDLSKRRIC